MSNSWIAIAPVVLAAFAAIAFAARTTPRTELGDIRPALAALAAWALVSAAGPQLTESPNRPLDGDPNALVLIAIGVAASLATLAVLSLREGAARGRRGAGLRAASS